MTSSVFKLVLFQVGNQHYGIDMSDVKNITGAGIIAAEKTGNEEEKSISKNNDDIPRLDLSKIFDEKDSVLNRTHKKQILIKDNTRYFALVVDRVDGVVNVKRNHLQPLPPIFGEPARTCFPFVLNHDDHIALILNPASIIDDDHSATLPVEANVETQGDQPGNSGYSAKHLKHDSASVDRSLMIDEGKETIINFEKQTETLMDHNIRQEGIAPDKLRDILTKMIHKKVSGKLKNIFSQALESNKLRD